LWTGHKRHGKASFLSGVGKHPQNYLHEVRVRVTVRFRFRFGVGVRRTGVEG